MVCFSWHLLFRWNTWTPTDPATLAELDERKEVEEQKKSKEFEENNPDFCKQMVDDMKTRSEARQVLSASRVSPCYSQFLLPGFKNRGCAVLFLSE